MTDATSFTSGALFTQDYLAEGIAKSSQYGAVDTDATRTRLAAILSTFPHSTNPNEATTEKDAIWPIMAVLGWDQYLTQQNLSVTGRVDVPDGLLFIDATAKAKANEHPEEYKRYQFGAAVFEAKRWGRALDRAEGRKGDDKDTPSTQLLRYMRIVDDRHNGAIRWGILTNGVKWRLYFSGARSTIDDYLEIDLARVLGLHDDLLDTGITATDRDHWLAVFVAMFGRTAFERQTDTSPSFHDTARRDAAFYEERVAKSLSDLVFTRLYPDLGKAVATAAPSETNLDEIRQATLILLYRLLFVLYAEDRGLLPVKDPRYDDYALRVSRLDVGKRKDAGDTFSSVAKTIWNRFSDLAEMIDKGDPSVGLPPYNGGLFNAENTPLLKAIGLGDAVMADALDILSFEQRDGERRYINYRDLSVQQLGSIYERLLEFELVRDETSGLVDVRPNIFARKNSGSYYTPDDLVLLILDETLEPLIAEAMSGFATALGQAKASDSDEYIIDNLQKEDPAKAITRLRVCDPAMGSGHFLVSLVDRLTNHTLDALAEAVALVRVRFPDLDYESPVVEEIRKIRGTIRGNAQNKNWSVSEEQLDDAQLVKRMVLKRCIYGADKNPMAVELAKVSLWLHTFTVGAPLSFIDHHLAAGDSLFGLWVRDAIDKAGKGGELLYIEELRTAERQAAFMQKIEALTDAEIGEAHDSAKLWQDIEFQVGPFNSFVSFIHALDWLDLKGSDKALVTLWLDGRFGDPLPIARGKKAPEDGKSKPEELERFTGIWQEARELINEERFLNWQIAFPGVWSNWTSKGLEGGFDAIVGNPPWDRFEFEEIPWFKARDLGIARQRTSAARKKSIRALEANNDTLWQDYQRASKRVQQAAGMAKESGLYSLAAGGKLNLYKLFAERALQLIKPQGVVGLVVPTGIAGDKSSSKFFKAISQNNNLKSLYDFENEGVYFPDVHNSQKFCVITFSKQRQFAATKMLFYAENVEQVRSDEPILVKSRDFLLINPNTCNAPILRSQREADLLSKLYQNTPVLNEHGTKQGPLWPISYRQMINMSSDSHHFKTSVELTEDEGAWAISPSEFSNGVTNWKPLSQGRMVGIYDHRQAGIGFNPENVQRPYFSIPVSVDEHKDPAFLPKFHSYIPTELIPADWYHTHILYRRSTASSNSRTLVSCLGPKIGYGDSVFLLIADLANSADNPAEALALLQGNLASFAIDFVARNKIQGQNFSWFILEQLPVIPPANYAVNFGHKSAADIVKSAVLELTYTSHDMAPFARDMGLLDNKGDVLPPFVWDDERRLHLRARLDAVYFILYGIFDPTDVASSRDDIRYIYSTFPIVERQEVATYGCYRSRDLCLAYINTLMAGQPDAVVSG
jgi:hypothetical protein